VENLAMRQVVQMLVLRVALVIMVFVLAILTMLELIVQNSGVQMDVTGKEFVMQVHFVNVLMDGLDSIVQSPLVLQIVLV